MDGGGFNNPRLFTFGMALGAFLALVFFFLFSKAAASAVLSPSCYTTRMELVSRLYYQYGEHRAGSGTVADRAVVEIFRTRDGATWTIIATDSEKSCIIASGQNWLRVRREREFGGQR